MRRLSVLACALLLAACARAPAPEATAPAAATGSGDVDRGRGPRRGPAGGRDDAGRCQRAAGRRQSQLGSAGAGLPRTHRTGGPRRPGAQLGDRTEPRRTGRCPRARRRAHGRPGARAAARHPGAAQGQHRRRRHGQLGRLAGDGGQPPRARRLPRRTPARRRRGDPGQDQPQRVGQLPLDALELGLELARRPDPQRLRARPQSLRLQRRHRHGHRGQPGDGGRGHRNRRQHHLPVGGERPGGPQAHGRPGQPRRHHPDLDLAGHGRARWAAAWPTWRRC